MGRDVLGAPKKIQNQELTEQQYETLVGLYPQIFRLQRTSRKFHGHQCAKVTGTSSSAASVMHEMDI